MKALSILLVSGLASASVVIIPGGEPKPFKAWPTVPLASTGSDLLLRSAPEEFKNISTKLVLSSYDNTLAGQKVSGDLFPSSDSFVRGAIQAWGEHLHLEIRPDEVWFSILTQMNFYMEANAESLRDLFVRHQGKEEIFVEDYTWTLVLLRFKEEIQARVKTPWLLDWILPGFTTTTESDVMTSNVLMMGLMKTYFSYVGSVVCGLPSVTLLGERADWVRLLAKVDRLGDFGEQPKLYLRRLRPILSRFVRSFDEPDSRETKAFWNSIAAAYEGTICGAPPTMLSGWITGFFFWDVNGKVINTSGSFTILDNVTYPIIDLRRLPVGYARAPFTMVDYGGYDKFPAFVAAGTLGKSISKTQPAGYAQALARNGGNASWAQRTDIHGTLRPLSGWMVYGPVNQSAVPAAIFGEGDEELYYIGRSARGLQCNQTW